MATQIYLSKHINPHFPLIHATPQISGYSKLNLKPKLNYLHGINTKYGINSTVEYTKKMSLIKCENNNTKGGVSGYGDAAVRKAQQVALWAAEAVYVVWLFLLPYAPGDPVWAISSSTINDLIGLSLNFFYVLPLLNKVGIHVLEAPVLHPMSEGLFNFVIGWTLLFAPLLFTDCKRDRYKWSLDVLWAFQMFLTNTFLIPYIAIRLNEADANYARPKPSTKLASLMTNGAPTVGLIGGAVCLLSVIWGLYARDDFGNLKDRWVFLLNYLGSERLAYAFVWDIVLYAIFQPWLIGDNLQNVKESRLEIVRNLRFIPVVGLVAYLLCLDDGEKVLD